MRWIAALLGIIFLLAGTVPPATGHAGRLEWSVRYQGRTIRVHVVTPETAGPWPLAIVLHGASGVGRGHMFWPMAKALADRGVAAAIVRYYDGLPARTKRKQSVRLFAERERILDHVIANLQRRGEVKGDRIGVYGYSLGGFHAIALAATDKRVAAAVSLAGGLSAHIPAATVGDAAPLMLIHGTGDRIVPYRRSTIARAVWRQAGQSATLVSMRNVGHVPYGRTRSAAFVTAADFLARHLKKSLRDGNTAGVPIPVAKPEIPVPRVPPFPRELADAQ